MGKLTEQFMLELGEKIYNESYKCEKTFSEVCDRNDVDTFVGRIAYDAYCKRNGITRGKYEPSEEITE